MGCYTDYGVSGYKANVKIGRKLAMNDEFISAMARSMLLAITNNCLQLGARAIGHIKCHIRSECGSMHADTIGTSQDAYASGHFECPIKNFSMTINCVVYGIPEEAVKAATLEGIFEVSERQGISVIKEEDSVYFDEFPFLPVNQDWIDRLEERFSGDDFEDEF
jgi:hypothetical protein